MLCGYCIAARNPRCGHCIVGGAARASCGTRTGGTRHSRSHCACQRLHRNGDGRCAAPARAADGGRHDRSEEHTSELQSLMRISYAVLCLKKKKSATAVSWTSTQIKHTTDEERAKTRTSNNEI